MGMMPLAVGLAESGWKVTGEDNYLSRDVADILERRRVLLKPLEDLPAHDLPALVVHSAAVKSDHPARIYAQSQEIPQLPRGEVLARISEDRQLIAICGSHGKSSTTAMLAHAVICHRLNISYYLGAKVFEDKFASGRLNGSTQIIAELDESDGSHLGFEPKMLCILNMDWDHSDKYSSEAAYRESFYALAKKTRSIVWVPEAEVAVFEPLVSPGVEVRGLAEQENFVQYNNAAAAAVLEALGETLTPQILEAFPTLERRQELLWHEGASEMLHDYAHHPKEIEALLKWLRSENPDERIEVYFEPHRYSRTEALAEDLIASLQSADKIALLPIYCAGESPESFDAGVWQRAIDASEKPITQYAEMADLFTELRKESAFPKGTVRAFVGAGNIEFLAAAYSTYLHGERATFGEILGVRIGQKYVDEHVRLAGKTTMRVGGEAEFYVEPPDRAALNDTLRLAKLCEEPVFILGKGSNVIVPDSGIQGCVVRLNQAAWLDITVKKNLGEVRVGAGVRLREICKAAEKAGFAGFEFMEGIPGSLGGALRMNAGAMGGWMSDIIQSIEVMTLDGVIQHLTKDQLHYGYRRIEELKECVVLTANLAATSRVARRAVKAHLLENMQKRKKSQPREASAGCIFKNPEGDKAGRLIDQCGLNGARFGDAQVSKVHANFIVNQGDATSEDILKLVGHIRKEVHAQTGVMLEPEAILVGSDWEEALS